jgi:hypothetical protein
MQAAKDLIKDLFTELNQRIEEIIRQRRDDGLLPIPKARVQLLGQISLLIIEKAAVELSLAQTGDLDALLTMDDIVKAELKKTLSKHGLIYDENRYLIWIPPEARFERLLDLDHILIEFIDAESALVSKAVKAPTKNKQLIREAIASEKFPTLVDRILKNGGRLEDFV